MLAHSWQREVDDVPRTLMEQLRFPTIEVTARATQEVMMKRYARRHQKLYRQMARDITPALHDWRSVWERAAFAILSANTSVSIAAEGLQRARQVWGLTESMRKGLSITPERATYVNNLPTGEHIFKLLKLPAETWDLYRLRIRHEVPGLAITKASYLACLLYPLHAQVACLDTWMLKVFGVARKFESLSDDEYRNTEQALVPIAKSARMNLGLAQWAVWDWARRRGPEPQRFFKY